MLLENLRVPFMNFNKQRIIVGFDTFEGYARQPTAEDGANASEVFLDDTYATGLDYKTYLDKPSKCMRGVIYWVINRIAPVGSQGMFVRQCPNI